MPRSPYGPSPRASEVSPEVAPGTDRWLRDLLRPVRRWIGLAAAFGWGEGLLVILQAFLLARLLASAVGQGAAGNQIPWLLLALVGTFLVRAMLEALGDLAGNRGGEILGARLRGDLVARGLAAHRPGRPGPTPAQQATALLERVDDLGAYAAGYRPRNITAVIVPVTLCAAVLTRSWLAALILAVTAPLIPLFAWLVAAGALRASRRQHRALARLGSHFLARVQGLTTLRLLDVIPREQVEMARTSEELRKRTLGVLRVAFLSTAVTTFFGAAGIAITAVYVGLTLLEGASFGFWAGPPDMETSFWLLLLAPEVYRPLRALGARHHLRAAALAAAETLRSLPGAETLRTLPEAETLRTLPGAEAGPASVEAAPGRAEGDRALPGIRFEGVSLRLDPGRPPVLRDISFEVAPGERVALVGPSGAGKTRVLECILGLHPEAEGRVLIDGEDLAASHPARWWARVAWLDQAPRLLHGSVRDNLLLGRPSAPEEAVARAARLAGVSRFARDLPGGLDTYVGDLGVGLSSGQIQCVALARALLRDADCLVLDEPLANLDAGTEAHLHESLDEAARGRTVVLATHRMDLCRWADRVLVLSEGRVVGEGSHEALLGAGGTYARLLSAEGRIGTQGEGPGGSARG